MGIHQHYKQHYNTYTALQALHNHRQEDKSLISHKKGKMAKQKQRNYIAKRPKNKVLPNAKPQSVQYLSIRPQ